jgi:hypothetical protein
MKRLIIGLLSVTALAFAGPAAADRPTTVTWEFTFPDVNPCTGDSMMVTIAGSGFVHEHGSREVAHFERTITTSDGFVGRGTESFVANGRIERFRFSDMMANASGDRFRARGVGVYHTSSDTVRVDRFELRCLSR